MIWYALILAGIVSILSFVITRDTRRALKTGGITVILGVILSLVIIYSGLMGG